MLTFLSLCLFFCAAFPFAQASSEIQDLLKRAAKKDQAVFASGYLHAAFSAWQDRFRLESFSVDSQFVKDEHAEIWLSRIGNTPNSRHRLALLVSRHAAPKIVEARRLLLTERERLQPIEHELVEFIERLAWIYEIGVESFMQDFLFPSHLRLRYSGRTNAPDILKQLRAKFKDTLPIQSLGWEGRNYTYIIRLVMDSPLQPLEISIDIQKHITANFFEMADKSERVQTLKDSLRLWVVSKRTHNAGRSLMITASTPAEAIAKVLAEQFKAYDLAVLDSTAKSAEIEASLPAIEQIRPASVRYRLEASRAGANTYAVWPIWLASSETRDTVAADKNAKQKTAAPVRHDRLVLEAVNETIQRYSTLDLPPAFQPEYSGAPNATGSLFIHDRQPDSVQWRGSLSFQNILQGIRRDKQTYFFLQGSTRSARKNVTVTGYAIWRDTKRLWQHIAKFNETYFSVDSRYRLHHVKMDLYPFIRLENVRALFAEPDTTGRRKKIVIQR